SVRYNFGNDVIAQQEFHKQKWCDCGYSTPEEMMEDQDMGFENPNWIRIAKYFIDIYNKEIEEQTIKNKEENVRFFLKLLKSSANNHYLSIELSDIKGNEKYEPIYDGKSKKKPKSNIFD